MMSWYLTDLSQETGRGLGILLCTHSAQELAELYTKLVMCGNLRQLHHTLVSKVGEAILESAPPGKYLPVSQLPTECCIPVRLSS